MRLLKREWYNPIMALPEKSGGSGVIYGRDPVSSRAENIGLQSGFPFRRQRQLNLYMELEGSASDQIVYAIVLKKTCGPVKAFKAKYPHIYFPSELEL